MCGIAGIYCREPRDRAGRYAGIERMTSRLTHRGPDDCGYYVDEFTALGHRRLSIIDLKTGQQPIFNEDGSACIVFNGEIYNYRENRAELIKRGHRFSTNSDTETIIHAYEEWGERGLTKLRGMFAFCIWDSRKKTLFLARDMLGKKPVFYAHSKGQFIFASEMKAILSDPEFDRTMDEEAIAAYFLLSYIPAPMTIYKNIRKLSPGHFLTVRDGTVAITEYWDINFEPDRRKKESDIIRTFSDILEESVKIRLVSEVPLGAFLSGGIDSSAVVALMSRKCPGPVKTFTIGFGGNTGNFDDERRYAQHVAQQYKTDHKEYEVKPDIGGLIKKITTAFDEPFADDSTIPSYYVCKMAREDVTVALSGLGGDEAFSGYERYLGFQMGRLYNKVPKIIREDIIRRLVLRVPDGFSFGFRTNHLKRFVRSSSASNARQYLGFITKMNKNYRESFFSGERKRCAGAFHSAEERFTTMFNHAKAEDPLNKVFYSDIKTYLPEDILACTDRMSMHHSLEVRAPFVDHKLLEYCATIPPEMKMKWFRKKYLLKKGVKHLIPKPVLNHRKQGFVGPMAQWLQTDLKELTLQTLSGNNLRKHNIFNPGTVQTIMDDHYGGREDNDTLIWSLLVFQTWFDLYQQ